MSVPQRTIGDVQVSAIGLGGMPLSVGERPDEDAGVRTIHAALDAGATLIDTADAYHRPADDVGHDDTGHNESLIARALREWSGDADSVLVATKGGHLQSPAGEWSVDGRPEHLKRAVKESAQRLGVDTIGLYQHHRPDPAVPYEETIGALRDLLDDGVIRQAGISNADLDQIRLAHTLLDGRLASVQNQFSPAFRSSRAELDLCAELGIAFLPWSPLGGMGQAAGLGEQFGAFAEVADAHGVSPQQVCLAWQLALSPTVVPIPGASRPESILDSLQAASLELSDDEIARLEATA